MYTTGGFLAWVAARKSKRMFLLSFTTIAIKAITVASYS